jgi:anti-anti-sigma regulatory factor
MEVIWLDEPSTEPARSAQVLERVLPLPSVLDSHAAVLIHLLLEQQRQRPVVLDASGVERLLPVGALLLASALRTRAEPAAPACIINLPYRLRRQIERHPLQRFLREDNPPPFA